MLSTKPLRGVTIIEVGHSVAAPYAGMILGELGADVIKVENPQTGGDYARGWGPPFTGSDATAFRVFNRAKGSVALDLGTQAGRLALRTLVIERADVLLHNFKFGALERMGLGPAGLLASKPALVYGNLGAFGSTGPLRAKPGYDPLIQAVSGLMSIQGQPEGDPARVGVSIIDMSAGMWLVIGILAALREVQRTGRGGVVDTSLYESALAWMTVPIASYLATGKLPQRTGSATPHIVPYQAFRTLDGFLMVAAGNDSLFRKLVATLGLAHIADDGRFATNADRVANRAELIGQLGERLAGHASAYWVERLDEVGVPNGPVMTLDEVVANPQTRALGILQEGPLAGERLIGLPLSFDGQRPRYERGAPRLGEQNELVESVMKDQAG